VFFPRRDAAFTSRAVSQSLRQNLPIPTYLPQRHHTPSTGIRQGKHHYDIGANRLNNCQRARCSAGVLPLAPCRFHFEGSQPKLATTSTTPTTYQPTTPRLYTVEPAVDKVSANTVVGLAD
jgi:hypothetical protein